MADDLIRYDLLVQDALRGVVRKVLGDAAREGLSGEHHFYVSFRTDFPGVRMSQRLREKYPQDMTIVLQHQFWDLGVTEHTFEVGLSFSGIPERLLIPFEAVTGFFDPSVQFGLKFELNENGEPVGATSEPGTTAGVVRSLRGAASEPTETPPRAAPRLPATTSAPASSGVPKLVPAARRDAEAPKEPAARGKTPKADAGKGEARNEPKPAPAEAAPGAPEPGAEVVSLDAFRKKS